MLYNCTEFGWHCVHRSLRSQKLTQIHFTPHFKLCAMKKSGLEGARKHLYFHSLQNRTLMNNLLVTQPAWLHYNSGSEEGSAIPQLQFDTTNKSIDTSIVVIRSPRHVAASCPPLNAKHLTSVFFRLCSSEQDGASDEFSLDNERCISGAVTKELIEVRALGDTTNDRRHSIWKTFRKHWEALTCQDGVSLWLKTVRSTGNWRSQTSQDTQQRIDVCTPWDYKRTARIPTKSPPRHVERIWTMSNKRSMSILSAWSALCDLATAL